MEGVIEMEIIIPSDEKKPKFLVKNPKGKKCIGVTKFLEESLGKVVERKLTKDYEEKNITEAGVVQKSSI